jgi:hypothetical protein
VLFRLGRDDLALGVVEDALSGLNKRPLQRVSNGNLSRRARLTFWPLVGVVWPNSPPHMMESYWAYEDS